MKPTLTADQILEKTFQNLKEMLNEKNKENRSRNQKRSNITNRHMCPQYQEEKGEFVVEQKKNNYNHKEEVVR
ncbi:MAG: hypothetical protein WBB23_06660 [Desulforhopalus sp.]